MTVERARELLELNEMTDEQVKEFIAQTKLLCKSMLQVIIKEHARKEVDKN